MTFGYPGAGSGEYRELAHEQEAYARQTVNDPATIAREEAVSEVRRRRRERREQRHRRWANALRRLKERRQGGA
jgi:hypothetical protein